MSETVKLIIEIPKEIYESRYGDECDEKDCLIIDTFTNAIANGIPLDENKREWISVTERLPEEDGQYLITVKYKHIDGYDDIYAEHGEWFEGKWDMFCFGHCGEVEDIIAWMPLPEPYKKGE